MSVLKVHGTSGPRMHDAVECTPSMSTSDVSRTQSYVLHSAILKKLIQSMCVMIFISWLCSQLSVQTKL